jgi:hypothetical protein
MAPEADDALDELRALLRLSRSIKVPASAHRGRLDRSVIITMWKRADETVETLLRLFPDGVPVAAPRVITALVAKWLMEGWATISWIARKRDRVVIYLSHGAAERVKLLRELYPELVVDKTRRRSAHASMPSIQQRIAEVAVSGLYGSYRAHCDASHWNSVWLRESMRDAKMPVGEHQWVRDLLLAATYYRLIVGRSAEACGRHVIANLDAIPSSAATVAGPEHP